MRRQLLCATAIASVLSGCTSYEFSETRSAAPTQFLSGNHSWRYQYQVKGGTIAITRIAEYSGEWQNNRPSGQGSLRVLRSHDASSCRGTFDVPWPATLAHVDSVNFIYADGEVLDNDGAVIYRGFFANNPTSAVGCIPTGLGTLYGNGWSLTSDDFTGMEAFREGYCTISAPGSAGARHWEGLCTVPDHSKYVNITKQETLDTIHDLLRVTKHEIPDAHVWREAFGDENSVFLRRHSTTPFVLANGQGSLRLANGDLLQGTFDVGRPSDGPMLLTTAGGEQWLIYAMGGELQPMRHPAPAAIASNGEHCGADGWLLMSGQCLDGRWHGDVEAYSEDGLERIAGHFSAGQADGAVSWSRLEGAHQVVGQLAPGQLPGFTRARITVAGTPRYEGEMQGLAPAGHGVCWVEGQPERCEYLHGARIDALYKTRQENRRLAAEQERQRQEQLAQQQAQQRLQQQRAQQQAQQRQAQQDGDFFGKALALGIGAAVVGSSGLDANVAAQAYSGFAADVMTDGQAGGIAAATQNIAAQQQATARAAATRPGLPLADETQSWERARSSVAGSSMQGASMANGTIAAGTAATGRAAPGGVGTPGGSLAAMAGFSQGKASADAARSDELNDNIAAVAARIGMKMREFTYQCGPQGEKTSVNVPYRSEACAAAKEYWFQVYACNDVYNMDKAIAQCRSGCGNPNCEEVE